MSFKFTPVGNTTPLPYSPGTRSRAITRARLVPRTPRCSESQTNASPSKLFGLRCLIYSGCIFLAALSLGEPPLPPLKLCFSFMLSFGFSNQSQTIQTPFHREESWVNREFGSSIFGGYFFYYCYY